MLDNKPITIEFENGSIIKSLPHSNNVRSKIKTYDDYWDESIEDEPKEIIINKI